MNSEDKLLEATMKVLINKNEGKKSNKYEIEYDAGAVERHHMPIQTETIYGDRKDLMNCLNELYVDCIEEDEDGEVIESFESWVEKYEDTYDPTGSTVVLRITENDKEIYKNSDYDEFTDRYEDEEEY